MRPAAPGRKKAVIAISSHVARGSVGNRAAVFALETLGHPVWSVPTVILPWHPGHGPSTRIVAGEEAFAAFIDDLAHAPWIDEVGAVLTGYLGAASQAKPIAGLVAALKRRDGRVLYACDPVIGDLGGLYVAPQTAEAIRDRLLPLADIATPNRFELAWLAGGGEGDETPIEVLARRLGPARVLVTSVASGEMTGNLLVSAAGTLRATHRASARAPNGLGDLTSALFLANLLSGLGDRAALRRTTATVLEVLGRTLGHGADELTLETDADCLRRPSAAVRLERVR